MSEWRESQGHEWCAKKQAKEVKPQSSGVCSGRSPLGGERRLGEPAGDGAGQVGRKAVFCLFICFLPSFLFTLLSYCGVVTYNKKCIFAWVLITTAPKTLEFSKSWKPWRCLLLRKGVTFVPHIRVRECLPVEPIMWLEGWNLRSQSLTSGEERGAGGWVQSPMASDLINHAYTIKLPLNPLNNRFGELPGRSTHRGVDLVVLRGPLHPSPMPCPLHHFHVANPELQPL